MPLVSSISSLYGYRGFTSEEEVLQESLVLKISPAYRGKTEWNLFTDGDLVLMPEGKTVTYTITPQTAANINLQLYGAGGGAGGSGNSAANIGWGSPGYHMAGTVDVTKSAYKVTLGLGGNAGLSNVSSKSGGVARSTNANKGNNAGVATTDKKFGGGGGAGGGRTEFLKGADYLLIAPGGGGGGGAGFNIELPRNYSRNPNYQGTVNAAIPEPTDPQNLDYTRETAGAGGHGGSGGGLQQDLQQTSETTVYGLNGLRGKEFVSTVAEGFVYREVENELTNYNDNGISVNNLYRNNDYYGAPKYWDDPQKTRIDGNLLLSGFGGSIRGQSGGNGIAIISSTYPFIDAIGGSESYADEYKLHCFTANGTFRILSLAGKAEYANIGILAVGAGGRGGAADTIKSYPYSGRDARHVNPGGGAGGLVIADIGNLSLGNYTVTVGSGLVMNPATDVGNGNPTSFSLGTNKIVEAYGGATINGTGASIPAYSNRDIPLSIIRQGVSGPSGSGSYVTVDSNKITAVPQIGGQSNFAQGTVKQIGSTTTQVAKPLGTIGIPYYGAMSDFNIYIDESKYTANFTVPTQFETITNNTAVSLFNNKNNLLKDKSNRSTIDNFNDVYLIDKNPIEHNAYALKMGYYRGLNAGTEGYRDTVTVSAANMNYPQSQWGSNINIEFFILDYDRIDESGIGTVPIILPPTADGLRPFMVQKNGNQLVLNFTFVTGYIGSGINQWEGATSVTVTLEKTQSNKWKHIVMSWATNGFAVFVNGQRIYYRPLTGPQRTGDLLKRTSTNIEFSNFNGYISNFHFHDTNNPADALYLPTADYITVPNPNISVTDNTKMLLGAEKNRIISVGTINNAATIGNAHTAPVNINLLAQDSASSNRWIGSPQYSSIPRSADYNTIDYFRAGNSGPLLTTGTFTIEFFVKPTKIRESFFNFETYSTILEDEANNVGSAGSSGFLLAMDTANTIKLRVSTQTNTSTTSSSSYRDFLYPEIISTTADSRLLANTWNHVAIARDTNNILRMFINGTLVSQCVYASSLGKIKKINTDGTVPTAASTWTSSSRNGAVLSQLHVTTTCKYTADFIPADTTVSDAGTVMLAYAQNTVGIANAGSTAILANANVWSGGETVCSTRSAEFSGGSIIVRDTSSRLDFDKDFTVSFWFKPVVTQKQTLFSIFNDSSPSEIAGAFFTLELDQDLSRINAILGNTSPAAEKEELIKFNGLTKLNINRWYHAAITRTGNICRVFLDGVQDIQFDIPRSDTGSQSYSYDFTNTWSGTTQNNYPTVTIPPAAVTLATQFCIDFWIYPVLDPAQIIEGGTGKADLTNRYSILTTTDESKGYRINLSSGLFGRGLAFTYITTGTNSTVEQFFTDARPELNKWSHVAITRNAGTWTIYINGQSQTARGTTTADIVPGANFTAFNATRTFTIESTATTIIGGSPALGFTGQDLGSNYYLSNFRISSNQIYTANFSVPTQPFTSIASTSLLLFTSTTFTDASSKKHVITPNTIALSKAIDDFNPWYNFIFPATSSVVIGSGKYKAVGHHGGGLVNNEIVRRLSIAAPSGGGLGSPGRSQSSYFASTPGGRPATVNFAGVLPAGPYGAGGSGSTMQQSSYEFPKYFGSGLRGWSDGHVTAGRYYSNITGPSGVLVIKYPFRKKNPESLCDLILSDRPKQPEGHFSLKMHAEGANMTFVPQSREGNPDGGIYHRSLFWNQNPYTFETWFQLDDDYVPHTKTIPAGEIDKHKLCFVSLYRRNPDYNGLSLTENYWMWGLGLSKDNKLFFGFNRSEIGNFSFALANNVEFTGSTTIQKNQWYHMAFVYNPDTNGARIYLNGSIELDTGTLEKSMELRFDGDSCFLSFFRPLYHADVTQQDGYFSGYVSNMRISSTARYYNSFSVPTQPFVADKHTEILTCQNSNFQDNSYANYLLRLNGSVSIVRKNPFSEPQETKWNLITDGPLVFDTPGTYTLSTQSSITTPVKMWGAGGGSSGQYNMPDISGQDSEVGGSGGFSAGLVKFQAGVTYRLIVGEGGCGSPYSGINYKDTVQNFGSSGGGASALVIANDNTAIMVAGGGGGAAGRTNTNHSAGRAGGGVQGEPSTISPANQNRSYAGGASATRFGPGLSDPNAENLVPGTSIVHPYDKDGINSPGNGPNGGDGRGQLLITRGGTGYGFGGNSMAMMITRDRPVPGTVDPVDYFNLNFILDKNQYSNQYEIRTIPGGGGGFYGGAGGSFRVYSDQYSFRTLLTWSGWCDPRGAGGGTGYINYDYVIKGITEAGTMGKPGCAGDPHRGDAGNPSYYSYSDPLSSKAPPGKIIIMP